MKPITRRQALINSAAAGAALMLGESAQAQPVDKLVDAEPPRYTLEERLNPILAGRTPRMERVHLEMPTLAEDGAVVPIRISVDSPMTESDHIRAMHLFVDNNPDPLIYSSDLHPSLGRAVWRLKIRMAEDSTVRVIAETNSGELFAGQTDVEVELSGCG